MVIQISVNTLNRDPNSAQLHNLFIGYVTDFTKALVQVIIKQLLMLIKKSDSHMYC